MGIQEQILRSWNTLAEKCPNSATDGNINFKPGANCTRGEQNMQHNLSV